MKSGRIKLEIAIIFLLVPRSPERFDNNISHCPIRSWAYRARSGSNFCWPFSGLMVFKEVDCWLVLMSLVNYSLLLDYSLLKGIVGFPPSEIVDTWSHRYFCYIWVLLMITVPFQGLYFKRQQKCFDIVGRQVKRGNQYETFGYWSENEFPWDTSKARPWKGGKAQAMSALGWVFQRNRNLLIKFNRIFSYFRNGLMWLWRMRCLTVCICRLDNQKNLRVEHTCAHRGPRISAQHPQGGS